MAVKETAANTTKQETNSLCTNIVLWIRKVALANPALKSFIVNRAFFPAEPKRVA